MHQVKITKLTTGSMLLTTAKLSASRLPAGKHIGEIRFKDGETKNALSAIQSTA